MPNEFVARNGIIALNNVQVLGNITQYNSSSYIGSNAGSGSVASTSSIYIGDQAGLNAASSSNVVFLGAYSGIRAFNSSYLTALGYQAGVSMSGASNSTAVGTSAGYGAANAIGSAFFGVYAGAAAVSSSYSTFIGPYAGWRVSGSSYSTFVGYNAGFNSTLGNNNILIGTNVTLASGSTNGINIGGLIFGSGSYFSTSSASSGSANGFIGINQPNPLFNLDVSGSARITSNTQITGSVNVSGSILVSAPGTAASITVAGTGTISLLGNAGSGNPGIQSSGVIHFQSPINGTGGTEILAIRKANGGANIVHFQAFGGTTLSTITGNGSLGLNKTYANATLDVSGSAVITGSLIISGSNPNTSSLSVIGTGSGVFTVDGSSGRLFSVDDSLSGSLFSVNTAAGLPVIEAFSDNTVRIGRYGTRVLYVSQSAVGVGKEASLNGILDISGSAVITGSLNLSGSFNINGTLTATTLVVQTITSSTVFSSGSNRFGNDLANTQVFTGSVSMTGSLTVNGPTTIINALAVGTSSLGSGENTLVLGLPPAGGIGEGGQILLQASGGLYTSASMLDVWQNQFRVLRGTNASSDDNLFRVNLHNGQVVFPKYSGSGAFPGTSVANLAVDSSGNILTVAPGTVTSASYAATASYIPPGTTLSISQINTGSVIASVSTDSGSFSVVSGSSTLLFVSRSGNVGIGTTNPTSKLQVLGTYRTLNAVSTNDQVPASFGSSGYSVSTIGFYGIGSANDYNVRIGANVDAFVAYTNDTERIRVTSGGNILIGKQYPNATLDVNGNTIVSGSLTVSGSITSTGTITAQTLVVQTITSSVIFSSGSNRFGNDLANTQTFTGSVLVTGSVNINGIQTYTGSDAVNAPRGTTRLFFNGGSNAGDYGPSLVFTQRYWGNDSNPVGMGQISSVKIGADGTFGGGLAFFTPAGTGNTFSERMRITNIGNVGIGTTNPTATLHVSTDTGVLIKGATSNSDAILSFLPTTGGRQYDFRNFGSSFGIVDSSANITRMYFNFSGNTGIGTLTPQASLHVSGATGGVFEVDGAAAVNALYVSASGQVGINNTTPTHMLDITTTRTGNGAGSTIRINRPDSGSYENAINWATGGTNKWFLGSDNDSTDNFYLYNWARGAFEIAVLSTSGNVGIGTSSPTTKLHVSGTALFEADNESSITIRSRTNAANSVLKFQEDSSVIRWQLIAAESDSGKFIISGSDMGPAFTINSSGNVGIGKTSPNAKLDVNGNAIITGSITATAGGFDSDLTLKNIVTRDLTQYRIADSVSPIIYTWKDTSKGTLQRFGYGAQELLPLIPEAVYQNGSGSAYAVDYTQVHTVLIDENTKRIQALERELAELKQIINALVNNK
jgi:hypothetical protein